MAAPGHQNGLGSNDAKNGNGPHRAANGSAKSGEASGMPKVREFIQEPIAIVSMACRLPDNCNNPRAFWKFLENGKVAKNTPPETRFSLATQYDGSLKGETMASPGGMFLQGVDPRDIDAQFFRLSRMEAMSMDPQQRQLLEVVYEGLENAGATMEELNGSKVGCFVSSFACDYADIQARDPENRASATMIGVGRAMLSNRLSHFFNLKGPSVTVDTACSGSLTCVDLACRYLHTGEISSAIVAGANIYLSPEHVMDHYMGANGTASLSGRCHTFDVKADGYIKAEAVNMLYLKRLDDAIRDNDPIRAVIRGSATNSDGWTPGIASPNSTAQAEVTRQAYRNAGITDLASTSYVEFHGTGTRAGDAIEANGVASVFAPHRADGDPLLVGSVKSNIGHSEPAAGISGMLKTILALEEGVIPGNPTFITPNPKIDFDLLKIRPSRNNVRWPKVELRRASVNSFGYGGSNAHLILEEAKGQRTYASSYLNDELDDPFGQEDVVQNSRLLLFSASDEQSLAKQLSELDRHLSDPAVSIKLRDLAYTLSERRSRHYHRGYIIANDTTLDIHDLTQGTASTETPKIGLIFTGQGAQWPEMGRELMEFPVARQQIKKLDQVLQNSYDPPTWNLFDELTAPRTAEHLRAPEISQPLVTALQLALLALLEASGVSCQAVVGHSSGEIAAAVAAGFLTTEQAIQVAYYRGKATSQVEYPYPVGMMAAGLDPEAVRPYLDGKSVKIACMNSPQSITLSGKKADLVEIEQNLKVDGHFARLLLVDAAYHSVYMDAAAKKYQALLEEAVDWSAAGRGQATMFSSTTGKALTYSPGPDYWVKNMRSPVLFSQALGKMITQTNSVDILVELGPSNALSGPVNQVKKAFGARIEYATAWKRGSEARQALLQLAGKLFTIGYPINLRHINADSEDIEAPPQLLNDLPNYPWNHSVKYWHETESSTDWRFRKFVHHDLLGGKILGSPWDHPTWKKDLRISQVTWLRDHKLGDNVVFPAAGYIGMAVEAIFQKSKATGRIPPDATAHRVTYKLRNVSFHRVLALEDDQDTKVQLSLEPCSSTKESWHEFVITSVSKDITSEHCRGLVSIGEHAGKPPSQDDLSPLQHSTPASIWYKAMRDVGYNFGPAFQRQISVESQAGSRHSRAIIDLSTPESRFPQNPYIIHPVAVDACLQTGTAALWQGHRSAVSSLMLPALIDELVLMAQPEDRRRSDRSIAVSDAIWTGVGRAEDEKRYMSNVCLFDEAHGNLLLQMKGLRYHVMDAGVNKPHTYTQVVWAPDAHFLTPEQLGRQLEEVGASDSENKTLADVAKLISLCAHKRPSAKIMEVNLNDGPTASQSLWIDSVRAQAGQIALGCSYRLCLPSQTSGLEARSRYSGESNIEYVVAESDTLFESVDDDKFDVVVLKTPVPRSASLELILARAKDAIKDQAYLLIIAEVNGIEVNGVSDQPLMGSMAISGFNSVPITNLTHHEDSLRLEWVGIHENDSNDSSKTMKEPGEIHQACFLDPKPAMDGIRDGLTSYGWNLKQHLVPFKSIPAESTVLVIDEMYNPLISRITDEQFQALKNLVHSGCRLLWVTMGSQMHVTHPELGLFFGTARTLLSEYQSHQIMCLDVESSTGSKSTQAIHKALGHLINATDLYSNDSEFVERGGVYYVSRVVPDISINKAEKDIEEGPELQDEIIKDHRSHIRLISRKQGTLDNLVYTEIPPEPPLDEDQVEVEVKAAALNFKDLANAMGFVGANDHRYGLECTGLITRVGKNNPDNLQIGERVLLVRRDAGCFANRVTARYHGVQRLPDWISFEDGATLGIAVHTVIYALVDLANVQKGQTVLIHSASGGVGLSAIDFCRYLGAEIYATVGTEAKKDFLVENYGIPRERIFSSRSVTFSTDLLKATNGRGVDVILNSLAGDMLHESWRCIAENGNFIEIGKKDMLDRNNLSMEPFDRNASYRAFDLSRKSITDETTRRIGIFKTELIKQGHIKPLHVCKVFPFVETIEAFRYMQHGKHIGKIVISYENTPSVKLPIRPTTASLQLRSDGSYLIAGGFKGLCGSLAVYLVRFGARNIVTMSRSGYDDATSQAVISNLRAMGCNVDLNVGDVTRIEDVRHAFETASKPIVGVIQGAMVLRDRMFTAMTAQEFREPIAPKVSGTWNLHQVSTEQAVPLDFFTMLSSVSGFAGLMGQTNYAAGNVFQDSFASYRLRQNLPACTVDLGVVEDVGFFVGHSSLSRRLEAAGWSPINEALLHRIIRASILQQTHALNSDASFAGQVIAGITVPLVPGQTPIDPLHRFSSLRAAAGSTSGSGSSGGGNANLALLKNASKADVDREALLAATVDVLNAVLTRSLGAAEPLEPLRPLASYGIDSLVAVELRNWVRTDLGVEVTALEVVGAKTLVSLCEVVLKKLMV